MRDYQRIRAIKGPADAQALEQCSYTNPEGPELPPAEPPTAAEPALQFAQESATDDDELQPTGLVDVAVLALKDNGRYQLVGIANDGHVLVMDCDDAGRLRVTVKSEQPLAPTIE